MHPTLPTTYCITDQNGRTVTDFANKLAKAFKYHALVQIRFKTMAYDVLVDLIAMVNKPLTCRLLVNSAMISSTFPDGIDGVHLTTADLYHYGKERSPFNQQSLAGKIIGASCHNARDLEQASWVGVDFVTLSPVCKTQSHPQASPLGWHRFGALVANTTIPVYALGGMKPNDIDQARAMGAAGVAGITNFWDC